MSGEREFIQEAVDRLQVGECITIDCHTFDRAFACGWPTIYRTSTEAFLSSQTGSAWGRIRVSRDMMTGDATISKHEEGSRRVYADPDREHLYRRDADGGLDFVGEKSGGQAPARSGHGKSSLMMSAGGSGGRGGTSDTGGRSMPVDDDGPDPPLTPEKPS
jgi:hypothetical protein